MAIRYAHTNIISDHWQELAHFYESVFECVPVPPMRDQSGQWLEEGTGVQGAHLQGIHLRLPGYGKGGPTLEIFQYNETEDRPPTAANRKGIGHIAFQVDDVPGTRNKVLAGGGAELGRVVTTQVESVGTLSFVYVTDPEGNIIEIQSWS